MQPTNDSTGRPQDEAGQGPQATNPNELLEKSKQQAYYITNLRVWAKLLDVEHLKDAYRQLQDRISWQQSASILSPRPRQTMAKIEVMKAQVALLRAIIALREVEEGALKAATNGLQRSEEMDDEIGRLFGL